MNVVILGTGGSSMDILDTLKDLNSASGKEEYRAIAFLDDDSSRWGKELHGVEVSGPLAKAAEFAADCRFVNGIGSPSNFWKKEGLIRRAGVPDEGFVTLVHPRASVSRTAVLGAGTVIFQNVTVNAQARVGNHVVVLPNSVISHDGMIGDYSCLATGVCLSGGVVIGKSSYVGSNSAIKENVRVGDQCLVGMGSIVLKDVPDGSVVAGSPARFLRRTVVT